MAQILSRLVKLEKERHELMWFGLIMKIAIVECHAKILSLVLIQMVCFIYVCAIK